MPSLFPSVGAQVVSLLIHFLGVSLLSHCFSRRIALEHLVSYSAIFHVPWPRLCLILVFLDSWLFLSSSGILIFGVGLELRASVCSAAILLCITFYATSKLLIYAFLIERVYIVWSPVSCVGRFRSPIYVVSFITVCLYSVVIVLMLFGRTYYYREGDMACMIGLKAVSSLPLLSYDLYINIFLTASFLWPLIRAESLNNRVRRVAKRALVASAIALTTSTVNIAVLTALRGHELGWFCLGSCGADVIINAYVLYWATGAKKRKGTPTFPSGIVSKDLNLIPVYQAGASIVRAPHRSGSHESQLCHPFSKGAFGPKYPVTEVHISVGDVATLQRPQPTLSRRLFGWFRQEHEPPTPQDIQITVTTETGVTHEIPYDSAESV